MHLGIVHDDGPDQLDINPRYGFIYRFPHDENGNPKECEEGNPLVGFANGNRGLANRSYLQYDLVSFDENPTSIVCKVNGKIIKPNDPSGPWFVLIQKGMECYERWKNGGTANSHENEALEAVLAIPTQ